MTGHRQVMESIPQQSLGNGCHSRKDTPRHSDNMYNDNRAALLTVLVNTTQIQVEMAFWMLNWHNITVWSKQFRFALLIAHSGPTISHVFGSHTNNKVCIYNNDNLNLIHVHSTGNTWLHSTDITFLHNQTRIWEISYPILLHLNKLIISRITKINASSFGHQKSIILKFYI
jgi:hypothetical protein